ncbi:MAG: hypothetical protein HRT94_02775 [Alphaproteobacteria bacterium]|nr:hypothetical protein [Alphaproteobacteria bacterium]
MTNISNLGQALDQISRIKDQQKTLDTLSTQIATGKKTQQFSGLGSDILRSQRARTSVNQLEQYSNNITNSHRRIQLMSNSIQEVQAQTNTMVQSLTVAVQAGDFPDFEVIQRLADDVYDFVIDAMNVKDGERYLFAGSDSSVKPIDDKGLFDSFLGEYVPDNSDITNPPLVAEGFIGDWGDGTITTQEFIDAYHATNENILGYSNALVSGTTGDVRVRVDENSDFDYTVLANTEGMQDIIIALGVLRSIPSPENSPGALNDPTATRPADDTPPFPSAEKQDNFYAVVQDVLQTLVGGVDKLEQEEFKLALVEQQTNLVKEDHRLQIDAFKTIISDVEDVDVTQAVAEIQQVQLSLETSFQVTALISDLTLANFL